MNIYQLWTFDEVDTLFYGPDRVIIYQEQSLRSIYHSIRSIEHICSQSISLDQVHRTFVLGLYHSIRSIEHLLLVYIT